MQMDSKKNEQGMDLTSSSSGSSIEEWPVVRLETKKLDSSVCNKSCHLTKKPYNTKVSYAHKFFSLITSFFHRLRIVGL